MDKNEGWGLVGKMKRRLKKKRGQDGGALKLYGFDGESGESLDGPTSLHDQFASGEFGHQASQPLVKEVKGWDGRCLDSPGVMGVLLEFRTSSYPWLEYHFRLSLLVHFYGNLRFSGFANHLYHSFVAKSGSDSCHVN